MVEEFFKMLEEYKGDSVEDILNKTITPEDIQLKTEYPNPVAVTKLRLLGEWLELNDIPEGKKIISLYIEEFSKNMVSYKRGSRKEIIQGIIGIMQRQLYEKNGMFGKEEMIR